MRMAIQCTQGRGLTTQRRESARLELDAFSDGQEEDFGILVDETHIELVVPFREVQFPRERSGDWIAE